MKLTISGTLGSGKSTVAKMIASELNLKQYQSGGFMRQMANERGITLNELSLIAEADRSIDDEIDARQKRLGEIEDNFIFESRLGYHFIPNSIKIYLKTSVDVAASRILKSMDGSNDERTREGLTNNQSEIVKSLIRRRESEKMRYMELYGLDYEDESNYDIVVDTSNITAEEVANIILNEIELINK